MKADARTQRDSVCYYGHGDKQKAIGILYVGADGFLSYRRLRPLSAWEREYAMAQRNTLA